MCSRRTPAGWAVAGVALACLMLLAWPLIGDATLAWVGLAGFAGFALVVAVLVRLALAGLARLPSRGEAWGSACACWRDGRGWPDCRPWRWRWAAWPS